MDCLLETDVKCAALGADVERLEFKVKRTKAAVFLLSTGSVAERNALAETHENTEKAHAEYCKALEEFNAMRNKRATETIVFEAWRSLNSNRRQGS